MSSSGSRNGNSSSSNGDNSEGNGTFRRSIIGSFKSLISKRSNDEGDATSPHLTAPGNHFNHNSPGSSSRSVPNADAPVPVARATSRSPAADSRSRSVNGSANAHHLSAPSSEAAAAAAAAAAATPDRRASRSPLLNPSPATRRPVATNDPPPPYEAVDTASPVGAGASASVPRRRHRPASLAPSTRSNLSHLTVNDVTNAEDRYAFLSTFDTIFVIDDSGSMAGRSWREVGAVLANIAPICTTRDADGIDLYFLNYKTPTTAHPPPPGKATGGYLNVCDVATVNRIFETVRPGGSTPTGTRISNILRPYLRHYEEMLQENPDEPDVKPVNMIVITDGEPSDDLEGVLINAAQRLDALYAPSFQVGIQFFKVGNEPGASEYLRHLDDNLGQLVRGQGVRDMVDTVTWDAYVHRAGTSHAGHAGLTADGILKAVLGAVVKRLDRLPTGPAQTPAPSR